MFKAAVASLVPLIWFSPSIADEPKCEKGYEFVGEPPRFDVIERSGSVELSIPIRLQGLDLAAINLSMLIPGPKGFEQVDVPLAFIEENGFAHTGISTIHGTNRIRYEVRAKYSDSPCGLWIFADF